MTPANGQAGLVQFLSSLQALEAFQRCDHSPCGENIEGSYGDEKDPPAAVVRWNHSRAPTGVLCDFALLTQQDGYPAGCLLAVQGSGQPVEGELKECSTHPFRCPGSVWS